MLSGNPGNVFTNVAPGDHTVNITCTSTTTGTTLSRSVSFSYDIPFYSKDLTMYWCCL